jgi:hypothetical protein
VAASSKTTPATPGPTTGASGATGATGSTGSTGAAPSATDPSVSTTIPILRVPAVSVDVSLPWFTGQPYALYSHVRAITAQGPTGWSAPFAFNMRWLDVPKPLASDPGFVRWNQVPGATSYQVWYPQISKVFSTHTNVADERDFYTWHFDASWWSKVQWRVRAVRQVFGDIPNGLPAVSYGPWSPVYTASNPNVTKGKIKLQTAVSDTTSTVARPTSHEIMPALTFSGDQGLDGKSYFLFRAYASTDIDCVNIVYRGAVVGSQAYAPRPTGPLKLPYSSTEVTAAMNGWLPDADNEGAGTLEADGTTLVTSEATDTVGGAAAGTAGTATKNSARVDLPDIDFPSTRYYWTVVPVELRTLADKSMRYVDVDLPQDACGAGRVASFGKESDPVRVGSGTPYVSGLTPNGRLLSSSGKQPTVFSTPLVAWEPATGAGAYEVQWSRTKYPWRAQGLKQTYSTSAVLNLTPGTWYYRVRGLNLTQIRKPQMSWSVPVRLSVSKPKFKLVASHKN